MKKILVFFIVFSTFTGFANPVTDFCHKNNIVSKAILMAVMPNDCAGCIAPVDELIEKIRRANNTIPIYIITSEALSDMEKILFTNKLGVGAFNIQFVGDETAYSYLTSKYDGIPSMCCVSETSEMVCLTNLKNGNLKPLLKYISPVFEVYISKTTELRSKYISSKNGGDCFSQIKNNTYVLYRQFNLLSQYNEAGDNTKNVFIDSLNIDYFDLVTKIFPASHAEANYAYQKSGKKRRNELINPVTMLKLGGDTLAIAVNVSCFKDTVYKKISVTIERQHSCLLLFNADMQYIGYLKFRAGDAGHILVHSQGLYSANGVFFLRSAGIDKFNMVYYKIMADSLHPVSQVAEPYRWKGSDYLQMLSADKVNPNSVFITYSTKSDNVRVYKYDIQNRDFTKVVQVKKTSMYSVNETKKGNYIGITYKHGTSAPVGYQTQTENLVTCKEQSAANNNPAYSGSFSLMLGNKLVEVAYKE